MNTQKPSDQLPAPRAVMTVQGPVPYETLGITDAHNHLWIEVVQGTDPTNPILNQFDAILRELTEYRTAGGKTVLDCQPEGCGRDGNQLLALAKASGVILIACTGFHRRKYYTPDYPLWHASAQKICDSLCSELTKGLFETLETPDPVRAGFIKIALESIWESCPQEALEGAAGAAARTKALIEIHTEKGALAERVCTYFTQIGIPANQLLLCHMDKTPDSGLHKAIASSGVLLEYDTFYRPKYSPASNLWPLLEEMVETGYSDRIALATDMADPALYHFIGGGAGLASFPGGIRRQLGAKGFSFLIQEKLLGGNIARRLAGLN